MKTSFVQAYSRGHSVHNLGFEEQKQDPNRVLIATETLLGPECKNISADTLPNLVLQQSWKPGRFMQDPKMDFALVTQLGMER